MFRFRLLTITSTVFRQDNIVPVLPFFISELNRCLLVPDPGPCKAKITRWAYDKSVKSCKQFTYGGCRGNGNNFRTKNECLQTCGENNGKFVPYQFKTTMLCFLGFFPYPSYLDIGVGLMDSLFGFLYVGEHFDKHKVQEFPKSTISRRFFWLANSDSYSQGKYIIMI